MGHFLALENTMNHQTQEMQVVDAMRQEGGFATLRRLNEIVDFSTWKPKTHEATIRRIVQESSHFFRIQPGLWALNESREIVLRVSNWCQVTFKAKNSLEDAVSYVCGYS